MRRDREVYMLYMTMRLCKMPDSGTTTCLNVFRFSEVGGVAMDRAESLPIRLQMDPRQIYAL